MSLPLESWIYISTYLNNAEIAVLSAVCRETHNAMYEATKHTSKHKFVLSYILGDMIKKNIPFVVINRMSYITPVLAYKQNRTTYSFGKYKPERVINQKQLYEKLDMFYKPQIEVRGEYTIKSLGIDEAVIYS